MSDSGHRPQVWGRVPPHNKDFTGREHLLAQLREGIGDQVTAVLPTALHGLGGVGKTQIAIEYAHRFRADYDVVWWIPSDQPVLIASSIARLAPHIGLPKVNETGVAEAAEAVVDALRKGEPFSRWLLVFDNAHEPDSIIKFVPDGPGDVLITSRNLEWEGVVRTLTVDVFDRRESRRFLDRRVPGIGDEEADALAEALGDLPLALDQAGALQSATGMPVGEYLDLLENQTSKLLAEGQPLEYDVPLTATWAVSVSRLRKEQPDAVELLHLAAFFGPDPIPRDVLSAGFDTVDAPLSDILSDPLRFSKAVGALGRYALVQIDRDRQTLEVHRLVQALLREDLNEDARRRFRFSVQRLLTAAVPKHPDDTATWPRFARLLPHIGPSLAAQASCHEIRLLMRSMTRYLYQSGNAPAAVVLAEECLKAWSADPESEARDLCAIKRHLAIALRYVGRYREAFELNALALADATEKLGSDHHETLRITNSHCTDLRASGDFPAAFRLEEESVARHRAVFGDHTEQTLKAQNNLSLDLTLTSRYEDAEQLLKYVFGAARDLYGSTTHPTVQIVMNNLIRVIRLRGDHAAAKELGEDAHATAVATLGADHPITLKAAKDLAIAMRKAEGGSDEVVEYAEDLLQRFQRLLGEQHPDALAAAMALVNAYREARRLEQGIELAEKVILSYPKVYGDDHPYTHGCRGNVALLLRLSGDTERARALHEASVDRLAAELGPEHHYTLVSATGLAGDLAALGDVSAAAQLGQTTLERLVAVLAPNHPMALACAANLAMDLEVLGRAEDAVRVRQRFPRGVDEHSAAGSVSAGERFDIDFDPPPI
jgi:tetratricopeptide (TPR) repeat protein